MQVTTPGPKQDTSSISRQVRADYVELAACGRPELVVIRNQQRVNIKALSKEQIIEAILKARHGAAAVETALRLKGASCGS